VSANPHDPPVNDPRIGQALKAVRLQLGLTQDEVGSAAAVSRFAVGRIERGKLDRLAIGTLRSVAAALDVEVDLVVRWRGGELGRLVSARHAAMHEALALEMSTRPDWTCEPEVSFSIYGERGAIDALAWHAPSRCLLVIELKSELVDVNDLMATMDRRLRLAAQIADKRGWQAATVSAWVAIAEGRTNRRAFARHRTTLRAKFPDDGHAARRWLRRPAGSIRALSFMPVEHVALGGASVAGARRVRHARFGAKG
jgi:transcriptional regulator with XRE-family HTH domain